MKTQLRWTTNLNVKKVSNIKWNGTAVHGRIIINISIVGDIRSNSKCYRFILQLNSHKNESCFPSSLCGRNEQKLSKRRSLNSTTHNRIQSIQESIQDEGSFIEHDSSNRRQSKQNAFVSPCHLRRQPNLNAIHWLLAAGTRLPTAHRFEKFKSKNY